MFNGHELLTDVFVTDTDTTASLKDCFADGAIITIPIRNNWRVELIIWGDSNEVINSFGDTSSCIIRCTTKDEVISAISAPYTHDDTIRYVIACDGPLSFAESNPTDLMSALKMAANSTVTQNLAINYAFDLADCMRSAAKAPDENTYFAVVSFGALRFRQNKWVQSPQGVVFAPDSDINNSHPLNVHLVPSLILARCNIDTSDHDLVHNEDATVTIDGETNSELWSCTCRVFYENERYEVCRYFPPHHIDTLPRAFLNMTDSVDWVIRDTIGNVDNLADTDQWRKSPTAAGILAACLPAVRDLVRRRTTVVQPEILEIAEQEVAAAVIEPAPDDTLRPPPIVEPPMLPPPMPVESPTPSSSVESWYDMTIRKVRAAYGDVAAEQTASILGNLETETPYTLVLGSDGHVQMLQGALPPAVIQHLTKTANIVSLPTNTGHTTRLYREPNGNTRIGRIKVDIESFLNCERISLYQGRAKGEKKRGSNYPAGAHLRPQRGAVHRFAKRMEIAKSLMYR